MFVYIDDRIDSDLPAECIDDKEGCNSAATLVA